MLRSVAGRGGACWCNGSIGVACRPAAAVPPPGVMRDVIRQLLLFGMVCLAGTVRGEIEWKERRVQLSPPAGAAEAVGEFVFINRGQEPVRIIDVTSGCGCTVAAPEPRVVPAGEEGRVRAEFHLGDRRGTQTVAVVVSTEEPEPRTHELLLEVHIKDFVSVAPRLLYWRVGEEPTPKRVQLVLAEGFRLVGVTSGDDAFAVTVVGGEGANQQLEVTPRDTWAKRGGSAVIRVAQGDDAPVEQRIALRIL